MTDMKAKAREEAEALLDADTTKHGLWHGEPAIYLGHAMNLLAAEIERRLLAEKVIEAAVWMWRQHKALHDLGCECGDGFETALAAYRAHGGTAG